MNRGLKNGKHSRLLDVRLETFLRSHEKRKFELFWRESRLNFYSPYQPFPLQSGKFSPSPSWNLGKRSHVVAAAEIFSWNQVFHLSPVKKLLESLTCPSYCGDCCIIVPTCFFQLMEKLTKYSWWTLSFYFVYRYNMDVEKMVNNSN